MYFYVDSSANVSCMIDGNSTGINQVQAGCGSDDGLVISGTQHTFSLVVYGVHESPVLFDGIEYWPVPDEGVSIYDLGLDMMYDPLYDATDEGSFHYDTQIPFWVWLPDDMLSFAFNGKVSNYSSSSIYSSSKTYQGISVAIYVNFINNSDTRIPPSKMTYTIDGSAPVDFSVSIPVFPEDTYIANQLLLQTPQLSPGLHNFNLKVIGPTDGGPYGIAMVPSLIIFQNHTIPVTRDAVPSATLTYALSNRSHIPIIAGSVGGTVLFLSLSLLVLCWFLKKRRKVRLEPGREMVEAFPSPETQTRSAQHTIAPYAKRGRQRRPSQSPGHLEETSRISGDVQDPSFSSQRYVNSVTDSPPVYSSITGSLSTTGRLEPLRSAVN